ncbi:Calcium-binding EF-hand family protein [Quillaja saponaria]|uniref:Calcium-binding EF-hand family protein n=1 Tax=Quillaja saponaria TaxID=32244 RepID=A0AAD7PXI2_QUISA|nr:Calcium-binding EF-hand family protein [Quillaja saponaria]
MPIDQLYNFITMEKTSYSDNNSSFPLFVLIDVLLFSTVPNRISKFFSIFWSFLLSQFNFGNSKKACGEKQNTDSELSHQKYCFDENKEDDEKVSREDAEMVMGKLGFFCSPENEELPNWLNSNELSGMFEEKEPCLEEVKQAFDVFDENKDGFIDANELQRVLCIFGLKEATELESCKKMIRTFDESGDGRIEFSEFVKIMENSFY